MTYLRYGGLLNDDSTESFLLSLTVKEFRKVVSIWRHYGEITVASFSQCILLGHTYV